MNIKPVHCILRLPYWWHVWKKPETCGSMAFRILVAGQLPTEPLCRPEINMFVSDVKAYKRRREIGSFLVSLFGWRRLVNWVNGTVGARFKSCKGSLRSLASLKPLLTTLRSCYKTICQQFLIPKIFKSMVRTLNGNIEMC